MLKKFVFACACAAAAALAGCAPATMQGLREKPGGSGSFEAAQDYQRVYRTVLDNARRCYQHGMVTATMVVQGDLFTDTRTGVVTVALHGGMGVDTHLGVDVKSLGENRTQVTTYHAMSGWSDSPAMVRQWVLDGSAECKAKK